MLIQMYWHKVLLNFNTQRYLIFKDENIKAQPTFKALQTKCNLI